MGRARVTRARGIPAGEDASPPGRWRVSWVSVSIRVVLADDSLIVREGIHQLLEDEDGIDVVASCGDLDEVSDAVRSLRPDVVVTDIRMPPSHTDEGIRLAEALRGSEPTLGVVVLSQYSEPEYVLALLERDRTGAPTCSRSASGPGPSWLGDRGRRRRGLGHRSEDRRGACGRRTARGPSPLAQLTPREREVLAEIAQGKSNTAIAESLVPDEARGGEAHQLDLPQARSGRRGGREQARDGRAPVPRRAPRPSARRGRRPSRVMRPPEVSRGADRAEGGS